jgi:hypothetical protein
MKRIGDGGGGVMIPPQAAQFKGRNMGGKMNISSKELSFFALNKF